MTTKSEMEAKVERDLPFRIRVCPTTTGLCEEGPAANMLAATSPGGMERLSRRFGPQVRPSLPHSTPPPHFSHFARGDPALAVYQLLSCLTSREVGARHSAGFLLARLQTVEVRTAPSSGRLLKPSQPHHAL